jgi:hypothetical protein
MQYLKEQKRQPMPKKPNNNDESDS